MNILFINSIQMFGGGEIWLFRTMLEMEKRGHRVYLLCRPGTPLESRAHERGFHVFTIPMSGDFDPLVIYRTYRCIRRLKPDVVCTNMDKELRFGGLAAKLAGVKAVVPRRGIDYPLKNTWIYRFAYNHLASGIIANSEATKQSLLKNSPWLEPDRIRVIYNGVHIRQFSSRPNTDVRRQLGIRKNEFVFGFVGQLDERKGVGTLAEAFRQLTETEHRICLLIVGEGKLETKLRQDARFCKGKIVFAGYRDDADEIMKAIDALVLPSLWEGFGIVLIEAMAAGKPVITTQISNMPEIVRNGVNGFLVPPSNPVLLAKAMRKMSSHPHQAKRMGNSGRRIARERFSLDRMVNATEAFFSELCAR